MKYKGQKFGAFAHKNWTKKSEDGYCGDRHNFLFSLTRDKRLDAKDASLSKKIVYQWITEDGIGFGLRDLVLQLDVSSSCNQIRFLTYIREAGQLRLAELIPLEKP